VACDPAGELRHDDQEQRVDPPFRTTAGLVGNRRLNHDLTNGFLRPGVQV
jgi:hypothetical protein